uniref:Signal transducer and activator of transcription n=1 Tax=Sinocyclocheilus grahami TaxID=75366 RepID=A0A672RTR1_SINGR
MPCAHSKTVGHSGVLEVKNYITTDINVSSRAAGSNLDLETASNHESMATVLFNNFLIQLERQCSQEQNFLHRHNLKRIFHQIQVTDAHCPPVISTHLMHSSVTYLTEFTTFSKEEYLSAMADMYTTVTYHFDVLDVVTMMCIPTVSKMFTLTAQSLFQIKRQLDKLGELILKVTYESDPIPLQRPQMEEQVKYLIYHLIKSSFVVEKEPCMPTHPQKPLIIKTQVQFTTKVRLLVKLPEVDYQLKVKTTFDKDLPPGKVNRQFFIPTNNTKVMDVEESTGCLSVEFRHLQLKERKCPTGGKGNEGPLSVTEELHSLNFEAMLMLQGLDIDLETCSLPLVVISNVSQLPGGWASVMWYNLLTDDPKNLGFFSNPLRASWSQLSEVLSWQFSSFAGRGLNKEQLNMLGDKLLGQHASYNDCQVSWSKFWKENIPGKSFSFWLWLDSILDLIKKHLLPVWIDGYIMGFVSKEMERALLKEKEPGTFLLRFSESHLGGITFTWVEQDENGDPKFISVEPYTKNRLNALPIADIIRDYKVIADGVVPENPLKFLYPDIPKDEAFGKHYNSQQNKVCPYIQTQLVPISHRNGPVQNACSSPEPPMSPGMFEIITQHLSPFEFESAVSNILNITNKQS